MDSHGSINTFLNGAESIRNALQDETNVSP